MPPAPDLHRSATDAASVRSLRGWARLAVSGFVGGGLATVAALRAAGHDPLRAPVRPGTGDSAGAAIRLLVGRGRP